MFCIDASLAQPSSFLSSFFFCLLILEGLRREKEGFVHSTQHLLSKSCRSMSRLGFHPQPPWWSMTLPKTSPRGGACRRNTSMFASMDDDALAANWNCFNRQSGSPRLSVLPCPRVRVLLLPPLPGLKILRQREFALGYLLVSRTMQEWMPSTASVASSSSRHVTTAHARTSAASRWSYRCKRGRRTINQSMVSKKNHTETW